MRIGWGYIISASDVPWLGGCESELRFYRRELDGGSHMHYRFMLFDFLHASAFVSVGAQLPTRCWCHRRISARQWLYCMLCFSTIKPLELKPWSVCPMRCQGACIYNITWLAFRQSLSSLSSLLCFPNVEALFSESRHQNLAPGTCLLYRVWVRAQKLPNPIARGQKPGKSELRNFEHIWRATYSYSVSAAERLAECNIVFE